jgi:hypothetical protein
MHFIIAFLLAASTFFTMAVPAEAQCPPGWTLDKKHNSCIVPGYIPCGNGSSCAPGSKCQRGKCVGLAPTVRCSNGSTCVAGEGCIPGGGCYSLAYQYLCGNHHCMKGFNYQPNHECFPCMGSAPIAIQDDWTLCTRPSTSETADTNIAACTRIISNPATTRERLIEAYQARCVEWLTKNQFNLALDDCSAAIARAPNYILALRSRAFAYEALGNRNSALADYRRAASLGDESSRRELIRLGTK